MSGSMPYLLSMGEYSIIQLNEIIEFDQVSVMLCWCWCWCWCGWLSGNFPANAQLFALII